MSDIFWDRGGDNTSGCLLRVWFPGDGSHCRFSDSLQLLPDSLVWGRWPDLFKSAFDGTEFIT